MTFTKHQKFLLNYKKYRSSDYFKILYHKFSDQYFNRSNLKNFQYTSIKNLKNKKINFLFAYSLLVNSSKIRNLVGCKSFCARQWGILQPFERWCGENSAYLKINQTSNMLNIQAIFLQTYYQKYNFKSSTTIKNFIVPINQTHINIRAKRQRFIRNSLKGILLVNFPEKEKNFLIKNLAAENKIPLITQSASLLLKDSRNMDDLLGVDDPIQILFDKVKTCIPCICFINNLDSIGKQRYEQEQKSLHWLNYSISLLIKHNLINKRRAEIDFGFRPSNLKLSDPKPKLATSYYHRLPIWLSNLKINPASQPLKKANWFGFSNNVYEAQKEKVIVSLQSSSSVAWKLWVFDKNSKSPLEINFFQTLSRCATFNQIKPVSKKFKQVSPSMFVLKTQTPFFVSRLKQQTVETKLLRFLSISHGLQINRLDSRLTLIDYFREAKEIRKQTSVSISDPYRNSHELILKKFVIDSNNFEMFQNKPGCISKKNTNSIALPKIKPRCATLDLKHFGKISHCAIGWGDKKKIPIITEKEPLISKSSKLVKDLKVFFSATVFDNDQARAQILFKRVLSSNSLNSPEWWQNPQNSAVGWNMVRENSTRQTISFNSPPSRAAGKPLIKNKSYTTTHLLTSKVIEDTKSNSIKISETDMIKRTALLKFLQILDGFHTPTEKKKSIFFPRPYLNLETLKNPVGRDLSENFFNVPKTIKSKSSKVKNHKHSLSMKNFWDPVVWQKKLKNHGNGLIINRVQNNIGFPYGITKVWMQLAKMNRFENLKKNYLSLNRINFFHAFSKNIPLKTRILQFNPVARRIVLLANPWLLANPRGKTRLLNFQNYKGSRSKNTDAFEPILQTRGVPKWDIYLKNQPFNKSLNLLCVWPSYIEDILGPGLNDAGSYILPEYFQLLGHGPKLKKQGITLIASTNDLTTLDAALLRPGRFDSIINFSYEFSSIDQSFNIKKHSASLAQNNRFSYYKSYKKEKQHINFSYKPRCATWLLANPRGKSYEKFLNKNLAASRPLNNLILFSSILAFNLNKIDYGFKLPNQTLSGPLRDMVVDHNNERLVSPLIEKLGSSIYVSTLSGLHVEPKKKLHTKFFTKGWQTRRNFKNQTKKVIINNFYSQGIAKRFTIFDTPNQSSSVKTFIDVSIFIQYKLWWNFHNEKLRWFHIDKKNIIQESRTRVSDEKFKTFKPNLSNHVLILQLNISKIRNLTNLFIGIIRMICFRFFYNIFQFFKVASRQILLLANLWWENKAIVSSKTSIHPNNHAINGLPQEVLISKVLTLGLPKKLKTLFNTDASEFLNVFKNSETNSKNKTGSFPLVGKNFIDDTIHVKHNNIFLKSNRNLLFCQGDFDYKAYTKKDDSIVLTSLFDSNQTGRTSCDPKSGKTSLKVRKRIFGSRRNKDKNRLLLNGFVYSDFDHKSESDSSSKTWKPFKAVVLKNVKRNHIRLTKYNQIYKLKKIKFKQQFFFNLHPFTNLILKRWPEITKPNKLKQYLKVPVVNNILPNFNFPLYQENKQNSSKMQNFGSLDLNKESPYIQISHNLYSMTVLIPIDISLLKRESKTVTRDNFFSTYESYLLKKLSINSSLDITCLQIYSTLPYFKTSKNWIYSLHLPKIKSRCATPRLKKIPRCTTPVKKIFSHNNVQITYKMNDDNTTTDQLEMKNNIVLLENTKEFLVSDSNSSSKRNPPYKAMEWNSNLKKKDNFIKTRNESFFQNYKMCRLDVSFFLLTFYTMFFEKIQNKKTTLNTIKIFMPYKSLIVSYFLLSQSSTYDFSCRNFEILVYNKFKNFLAPIF